MDNLNDLKSLWHTADTSGLPKSEEIMRMGKKFRGKKLRNKILTIITCVISISMLVCTLFLYKSSMLSTRIGEIFIIISGGILLYTNLNSIGRFYYYKDYSNKEFIAFLEQTRLNQIYFYKRTQLIAMLFYTPGLLLYMYEIVYGNTRLTIIFYSLTIIALLYMWLYRRPRSFKKQAAKLDETMTKLKALSDQL